MRVNYLSSILELSNARKKDLSLEQKKSNESNSLVFSRGNYNRIYLCANFRIPGRRQIPSIKRNLIRYATSMTQMLV